MIVCIVPPSVVEYYHFLLTPPAGLFLYLKHDFTGRNYQREVNPIKPASITVRTRYQSACGGEKHIQQCVAQHPRSISACQLV